MPTSGILAISTLLFWALITPPVRYLLEGGGSVYLLSGVAGLICLTPALVTLIGAEILFAGKPDALILAFFASSVIRLIVVSGAAYYLSVGLAYFHEFAFLIWIAVFYLFVLGLETYLVAAQRARTIS
jgi:hypothetical protein